MGLEAAIEGLFLGGLVNGDVTMLHGPGARADDPAATGSLRSTAALALACSGQP
jgi:hypothetical protein